MAVTVMSGALLGVDAIPIEVEVDLLRRLPSVCIVGLAASAVRESAERIRSAIESVGESFPRKRVVVNLAPAGVKKEGTALDLPMALGILAAEGLIPVDAVQRIMAVGELSLGGALRPVRGALSLALLAKEVGRPLVLPRCCASAASLVPGVQVLGADTLGQVVAWLRGEGAPAGQVDVPAEAWEDEVDLADVRGQSVPRRALEIAAAGGHHLLMLGPPGCGKSMLAQRLPTILPPLTFEEALATTRVHNAAGLIDGGRLIGRRPFRAPHHSVTVAGLIGDQTLRPGEVSLAHNGVLFLDEAPEFMRSALEVLRQPLEDGVVRLSRARGTVTYPAEITLVMAANPCTCGMRGIGSCSCTDGAVAQYLRRISGPILDRVDLYVELEPVSSAELFDVDPGEDSASVRARVVAARDRQLARGQSRPNARLPARELHGLLALEGEAREALVQGAAIYRLSARATTKVLKVSRTLADLDGSERVQECHVLRALNYRLRL